MNIFRKEAGCCLDSLRSFSVLIATLLTFISCSKEAEVTTVSGISIVNASPTIATYNAYLDGSKIVNAALSFGGTVSYIQVTSADHVLKFTTESDVTPLMTKTVSLSGDQAYSFYLIDRNDQLDGLLVKDDLVTYSTEKAFVRFINLSPDAPALDLGITEGTSNLISNQAYKESSGFSEIDPATTSFDIKDKATGEIRATINGIKMIAGYYYTVIARGVMTPGALDQHFSGQIYLHK